ncbi:MAG: hypothetical protein C0592_10785 [Marinilabiliales bacterium]|nr:MAG: hypothetical protein C0592_10785 [Marinilabiliales bacterium]
MNMDAKIVKETLIELIKENSESDGWMNLANLGLELSKNRIDYKELGHYKLTNFITSYSDILEIKKDETHKIPVYYVKLRNEPSQTEKNKIVKSFPKNALTDWAYLKHYQTTFDKLKNMALEERWYYKIKNPNFPYPILSSYLHYTFYKLSREKGKILSNEKYSVFNTGLVDNRYEPIYALFEKNTTYTQQWKLVEFCIAGEGYAGKELVRNFKDMPKRAHYFSNVSDMLYDTRAGEPELDMRHIILDNAGRLPLHFLSDNQPKNFQIKNPDILTIENRCKYYEDLANAIERDTKTYRNLTNRLKDAITLAIKRIEWNFKTAIPMYYPTEDKMSLLLPLSLVDDEIVDVALVVEKTKSGNYIGHTILPLNWAYNNARLVARPDSDWLVAEQIDITKDIDDEDNDDE